VARGQRSGGDDQCNEFGSHRHLYRFATVCGSSMDRKGTDVLPGTGPSGYREGAATSYYHSCVFASHCCSVQGLVAFKDENGDSVFEKEGFFEREKYGKASSEAVKNSMKRLAYYTGIENKEGASSNIVDGEPEEEGRKRERLIAQMANVIREACERYGIQVKGRA